MKEKETERKINEYLVDRYASLRSNFCRKFELRYKARTVIKIRRTERGLQFPEWQRSK